MKTIWKFELQSEDKQNFEMPLDAEILSVQVQNEKPCLWALVDTEEEMETRYFEIFGTGHRVGVDMGVDRKFIGTYQLLNGSFVGHVFERIN